MYEFLVGNPTLSIIFIAIMTVVAVFIILKEIKRIGIEAIRGYVYDGFVQAEHIFEHGANEQKFDYVVQLARRHLPTQLSLFITEESLRKTIQLWFGLVKDLLDDGRINKSASKKEDDNKE